MEDNIQTVLIFLISAVILFIFPVYIAYEKKDDVSYALVLSYTQSFVEEIRSKGYITSEDYSEYISMISSTGNVFDVKMEHKHKVVYPGDTVKCYGTDPATGASIDTTKTLEEYNQMSQTQKDVYDKIVVEQKTDTEIYDTRYILNIIGTEKPNADPTIHEYYDYYMNTDDVFSITVKNRNTTLATVMYNLVTINSQDTNTRIYVNYAGQINDEKWYNSNPSYYISDSYILGKMLHLQSCYEYKDINAISRSSDISVDTFTNSFTIELNTDPNSNITSIANLGSTNISSGDIPNGKIFNNNSSRNNKFILHVGENGVMVLLQNSTSLYSVVLNYAGKITRDDIIKIAVKKQSSTSTSLALFVNDERVCFNELGVVGVTTEGAYIVDNSTYKGTINYFRIYKTSD